MISQSLQRWRRGPCVVPACSRTTTADDHQERLAPPLWLSLGSDKSSLTPLSHGHVIRRLDRLVAVAVAVAPTGTKTPGA